MSYSSKVLYTGDGVQDTYNIPMPYISPSHIFVYVNEILQLNPMNYTWAGASTIKFSSPPGNGDAIEIKRWTSPTATLVDFVDGSTLRESDLDTAYLHNYYLSQEYADSFNDLIQQTLVRFATSQGIEETDPDQIILDLVADMLNSANAANLQQRITDIDANAEAIITLGEGLQAQINTLAEGVAAAVFVQPDEPVPGVGGVPNPIPEGARWYDTDDSNKPYIYQSGAWISISDPRIGLAEADIDLLQVQTENVASLIIDEMFVRAQQDEAFSQQFSLLGSANGDNTAFIVDLDTTKVSDTESLADRFTQITADWTSADATVLSTANGYTDGEIVTVNASITSEQTARANADGALAADIALIGAANAGNTAFILDSNTVKIDSDGGDTFAEKITALEAADSSNSASITTLQTVTVPGVQADADAAQATADVNTGKVNTLEAKYGVSLNVNGYITGFIQNNSGTSGSFVILADKFAVVDPSGDPGETEYVPFEISGGKINMRSDVKIDGDLIVTGTVNGTALINGTIGSTQIGANAISTTHISANAVTANEIAANAVTASKINVTNLNAVKANTGALTVDGTLTVGTAGKMLSSGTGFQSGAGFFLGYDSTAYKFYVGDYSAGDYLSWDGTELKVRGNLSIGSYTQSTTEVLLSAPTERTHGTFTFTEKKKFKINKPGSVYVYFEGKMASTTGGVLQSSQIRTKLDGVVQDTEYFSSTTWSLRNSLISTSETSDYITIELRAGERNPVEPVTVNTHIRNAEVRAIIDFGESVITD